MNTVQYLEQEKFKYFDEIKDKRKRGAQVNAVRYIKDLASMTRTDISDWDVVKVFSDESGALHTDRKKINRIFFAFKETAPIKKYNIDDQIVKKLAVFENKRKANGADRILQQGIRKVEEAKRYQESIRGLLKQAAALYQQADLIRGYKPNWAREVEQIHEQGFWKFVDVNDYGPVFETVNDVILTHIDTKFGVLRSVNLEKFRCNYHVSDAYVLVFPTETSITRGFSYPHPHINDSNLCFGQLSDEAYNFMTSGNLSKVLEYVQLALTSYNPDSPYRVLEKIEEDIFKKDPSRMKEKDDGKASKTKAQQAAEAASARQ